ncbi:MAG: hypothetical protein IT323_20695 [Anaerolineae bacterium]|nr:hypothetical protein [Anaerolineae bacterium]
MRRPLLITAVLLILLLSFASSGQPARGQGDGDSPPTVYDVFLTDDGDAAAQQVLFVDARTGLSVVVAAPGSDHTLIKQGVIYREAGTGFVRIATPDGRADIFAPIPPGQPNVRVDWVVSPGRERLAWTVTVSDGPNLVSDLYIAPGDGSGAQLALHATSTQGIGVLPLAVGDAGDWVDYARRADLFAPPSEDGSAPPSPRSAVDEALRLDVAAGASAPLPELPATAPGCPCPVAVTPDGARFARLWADEDGAFAVTVWEIGADFSAQVEPLATDYERAAGLLLSPDGERAVYTLARGQTRLRYALVVANLLTGEQRLVNDRLDGDLRAAAFVAGGEALLMTGALGEGTYKVWLADGVAVQVSPHTYLGHIG